MRLKQIDYCERTLDKKLISLQMTLIGSAGTELEMNQIGTYSADDECSTWERVGEITQIVLYYEEFVHGLTIETTE